MSNRFPSLKLPLIVDNTIISNFGLIDKFDILKGLYSKNIVIPTAVIIESIARTSLEKNVHTAFIDGWAEEYSLSYSTGRGKAELEIYKSIKQKFGDGEAAVIAIAKTLDCTVASDDMRATRKYCTQQGIIQIGSLGILYNAYQKGLIDANTADEILGQMLYYATYDSPVANFSQVINWFEKGTGREIY